MGPWQGIILLGCFAWSCSLIVRSKLDEPGTDGAVARDGQSGDMRVPPEQGGPVVDSSPTSEGITPPPPQALCSGQPRLLADDLLAPATPEAFAMQVDLDGIPHIVFITPGFTVDHLWWREDDQRWQRQGDLTEGLLVERVALVSTGNKQLHLIYREQANPNIVGTINKRAGVGDSTWTGKWSNPITAELPFSVTSIDGGGYATGMTSNTSTLFVSAAGEGHAYIRVKLKATGASDGHNVCFNESSPADHTRLAVSADQPFFVSSRFDVLDSLFSLQAGIWADSQDCPSISGQQVIYATTDNTSTTPRPAAVALQGSSKAHFLFVKSSTDTPFGNTGGQLHLATWLINGNFFPDPLPFDPIVATSSPSLAIGAGGHLFALFTTGESTADSPGTLHGAHLDPSVDPPWQFLPLADPVQAPTRIALDATNHVHAAYLVRDDTSPEPHLQLHHLCRKTLP